MEIWVVSQDTFASIFLVHERLFLYSHIPKKCKFLAVSYRFYLKRWYEMPSCQTY